MYCRLMPALTVTVSENQNIFGIKMCNVCNMYCCHLELFLKETTSENRYIKTHKKKCNKALEPEDIAM